MGGGIAKVDQQAVPEILRNVAPIVVDDRGTETLILLHRGPPFFGIQVLSEVGRAHEVTEHHGQLPAFAASQSRV